MEAFSTAAACRMMFPQLSFFRTSSLSYRRRFHTVLPMLCLAVFALLLPSLPGWAAGTPQATAVLPYGGRVSRDAARHIGQVEAWLAALRPAARKLESRTVVQLGATTLSKRLALAAAVTSPLFRLSPNDTLPEGELTVTARLPEVPEPAARLRTALRHPEVLALFTKAIESMEKDVAEGRELMLRAAELRRSHGPGTDHMFAQRILYLADRLEALRMYTDTLRQLGDRWENPAAAARDLRRAVILDKNNPLLWCALGEAQLQQDLPQAALESLDKAVLLAPDMARALYIRGLAQLRLRQSSLAEADLTAALRLRPDIPQWLRTRGAIRMVREDYGPMCEDFYRACMLGDCDGLEAARKRSQCLSGSETTHTAEKETTTPDQAASPGESAPPEPTEPPSPPLPTVANREETPAASQIFPKKETGPATAVSPASTPPPDAWPQRPEQPRRVVAARATDAPSYDAVIPSQAPVVLNLPHPTATQTAEAGPAPSGTAETPAPVSPATMGASVPLRSASQEKTLLPDAPAASAAPAPTAWPPLSGQPRRAVAVRATDAPPYGVVIPSPASVVLNLPLPTPTRTAEALPAPSDAAETSAPVPPATAGASAPLHGASQEKTPLPDAPAASAAPAPTAWPPLPGHARRAVAVRATDAPPYGVVTASSDPVFLPPSLSSVRHTATAASEFPDTTEAPVPVRSSPEQKTSRAAETATSPAPIPTAWPPLSEQTRRTVADHHTDAP